VVCVVLLLRYRRRQEQRAAAQAGTEQDHEKREPEAPTTKPSLSVSEAPVAAILPPVELDAGQTAELGGKQRYEIDTPPPTSSPGRET
jgi:hypothetical protein